MKIDRPNLINYLKNERQSTRIESPCANSGGVAHRKHKSNKWDPLPSNRANTHQVHKFPQRGFYVYKNAYKSSLFFVNVNFKNYLYVYIYII